MGVSVPHQTSLVNPRDNQTNLEITEDDIISNISFLGKEYFSLLADIQTGVRMFFHARRMLLFYLLNKQKSLLVD